MAFPFLLSVVAIHAFVTAFSITGNQKRDYYDSIQCALMVGGNLPPNHTIPVINLLSALFPVPCRNLLPERQRARLENGEIDQKERGETENGKWLFDGSGGKLLLPFYWGVRMWVGVLSTQYCRKTRKQNNIWWRKKLFPAQSSTRTHTHRFDVSSNMQ